MSSRNSFIVSLKICVKHLVIIIRCFVLLFLLFFCVVDNVSAFDIVNQNKTMEKFGAFQFLLKYGAFLCLGSVIPL